MREISIHPLNRYTPLWAIALACALICLSLGIGVSPAHANPFYTPTWRGSTNTTFQEWDIFSDASTFGTNAPDVINNNPNGTANVSETLGEQAFITSTANIYSLEGNTAYEATVPIFDLGTPGGDFTTVVVQIGVLGTELDLNSVNLIGGNLTHYEERIRINLGGQVQGGGDAVLHAFGFQTRTTGPSPELSLLFASETASMSLDVLLIDTITSTTNFSPIDLTPIPEPRSIFIFLPILVLAHRTTRR